MRKFYFIIFFLAFLFPVLVLAQNSCPPETSLVPCGGSNCPCTLCHLFEMINRIVRFLLKDIVPIVAGIMIVIAGILMISSYVGQGGPENIIRAKKLLSSIIIGMLIIYTAWILISIFLQTIGVMDWTGLNTWWIINCDSSPSAPTSPSTSVPSQPSSPSQPSQPVQPPVSQIQACNACSGNELGQCSQSECLSNPNLGCNYIQVTLVGGLTGGKCVAPGDCNACGALAVGIGCTNSECGQIGGGCLWVQGFGGGICVAPGDCVKCAQLPGGCTQSACKQISGQCNYIDGILGSPGMCL